eukprot:CCRYP_006167-RA/>CCRYP_006167-RA protein AED:0.48 eAED:0.48 QI:201/1/0.5/1/0/0/2/0/75
MKFCISSQDTRSSSVMRSTYLYPAVSSKWMCQKESIFTPGESFAAAAAKSPSKIFRHMNSQYCSATTGEKLLCVY